MNKRNMLYLITLVGLMHSTTVLSMERFKKTLKAVPNPFRKQEEHYERTPGLHLDELPSEILCLIGATLVKETTKESVQEQVTNYFNFRVVNRGIRENTEMAIDALSCSKKSELLKVILNKKNNNDKAQQLINCGASIIDLELKYKLLKKYINKKDLDSIKTFLKLLSHEVSLKKIEGEQLKELFQRLNDSPQRKYSLLDCAVDIAQDSKDSEFIKSFLSLINEEQPGLLYQLTLNKKIENIKPEIRVIIRDYISLK